MFGCSHIQTTQNHQVVRFQPYRAIPTTQSVARSLQGTLGCICFQPRNTGSESPDTRNHGAHGLHLEPEVWVENLRSVCLLCPAEVDEDRVLGTGRGQRKSLLLPTSHRPPAYNGSCNFSLPPPCPQCPQLGDVQLQRHLLPSCR